MIVVFWTLAQGAIAQTTEPVLHEQIVRQNGRIIGYTECDRSGNTVLTVNDGMSGPVTMAIAFRYDSIGRELRSVLVHSNVGCYISDRTYLPGRRLTYEYSKQVASFSSPLREMVNREILAELRTVEEVEALPDVRAALLRTRYLSTIELVDTSGRTVEEFGLNEQGDTVAHHVHAYNQEGKEVYFRYGGDSPGWTWEYFATFDGAGNKVRWARVVDKEGVRDTSELDLYQYDPAGRMTEHLRYVGKELRFTEQHTYDKNGRLVETRSINAPGSDKVWLKKFTRGRDGSVRRERLFLVEKGRAKKEHDHRITYEYW